MRNSYMKRNTVGEYRPQRSVEQCMSLLDAKQARDGYFYKEVSAEEAHDLFCVGKKLVFNIVPSVDTFWKPASICRAELKKNGLGSLRYKDVLEYIIKPNLPKARGMEKLYIFVVVPVMVKRAPRHAISV